MASDTRRRPNVRANETLRMSHKKCEPPRQCFCEMRDPSQSYNQTQPPTHGLYLTDHCGQSDSTYQTNQQSHAQESDREANKLPKLHMGSRHR